MLSFQVGTIRIQIWFSFFAVICLFMAIGQNEWGLWCISAGILHESGHLAALLFLGFPPKELHFEYSGIRLVPQKHFYSFSQELFFLCSGSGINLLIFALLHAVGFPMAAAFHLVLGIFNLLPLQGLDGGQILRLTTDRIGGLRSSAILCAIISCVTDGFLIYYGLKIFIASRNFTLLLIVFYFLLLGFSVEKK